MCNTGSGHPPRRRRMTRRGGWRLWSLGPRLRNAYSSSPRPPSWSPPESSKGTVPFVLSLAISMVRLPVTFGAQASSVGQEWELPWAAVDSSRLVRRWTGKRCVYIAGLERLHAVNGEIEKTSMSRGYGPLSTFHSSHPFSCMQKTLLGYLKQQRVVKHRKPLSRSAARVLFVCPDCSPCFLHTKYMYEAVCHSRSVCHGRR